jgi:predicted nucleic acid-binding protein
MLYLDASALTKLVIEERETDALQSHVRGHQLATSRLAIVELTKAVARTDPTIDPQPVLALLAFVELDADLARIAGATGGTDLRSLDAIHVASALRLGGEVEAFVTYDVHQAAAARLAGLPVASPGPT